MVAETTFGISSGWEEPTLDTAGLIFLASGISLLGQVDDGQRVKAVVLMGGFGGIGIILVGGFLRLDNHALFYVGTAIAVATSVGLSLHVLFRASTDAG